MQKSFMTLTIALSLFLELRTVSQSVWLNSKRFKNLLDKKYFWGTA